MRQRESPFVSFVAKPTESFSRTWYRTGVMQRDMMNEKCQRHDVVREGHAPENRIPAPLGAPRPRPPVRLRRAARCGRLVGAADKRAGRVLLGRWRRSARCRRDPFARPDGDSCRHAARWRDRGRHGPRRTSPRRGDRRHRRAPQPREDRRARAHARAHHRRGPRAEGAGGRPRRRRHRVARRRRERLWRLRGPHAGAHRDERPKRPLPGQRRGTSPTP